MSKNKNISNESQAQAVLIASGTKKVGQTKEQTKLISAGIEKGIAQYKKQHKAKMREQDKLRKKRIKVSIADNEDTTSLQAQSPSEYKKSKGIIPWLLLMVSWLLFIGYFFAY
ncbi:MAG: DUF2956 domain-containing protein [Colwellia sp.]